MPREKMKTIAAGCSIDNEIDLEVESPDNNITIPDLNKFKFQKKSHVKIEFEKEERERDSSAKEMNKGLWKPPKWKEFLINLRNMRSNQDAPVDSMGCHMCMDESAPPKVIRYQSLISLMLSSQTKDQVTFAAMERLRSRGLTVDSVLNMTDEELGKLIYPVGFWKTKVKYIKKTTQTLKEQYDSDIPDSVEKLCKLTGVGPKMAHICMKVAWNKVTGIGVDTHVHRISNRIGWVKNPTSSPEGTRKALETWLPFNLWSEVNHLMVGFGQTICLPVGPMCHECLNNDICPSSGKGRKSPNKKSPSKLKEELKVEKVDLDNLSTNSNLTASLASNKDSKSPNKNSQSKIKEQIKVNVDSGKNILINDSSLPSLLSDIGRKSPNKKSPRKVKRELKIEDVDVDDLSTNSVKDKKIKKANRKVMSPSKVMIEVENVENEEYQNSETVNTDIEITTGTNTIERNPENIKTSHKRQSSRIANRNPPTESSKKKK